MQSNDDVRVTEQIGEFPIGAPGSARTLLSMVLVMAATALPTLTIAATHNSNNYVYLYKLAHPAVGWFASLALFALAAWVGIRTLALRSLMTGGAVLLLLLSVCVWSAVSSVGPGYASRTHRVVLASSGGYELIRYTTSFVTTDTEDPADGYLLVIEHPNGISSQAERDELGCFVTPDSDADPKWTFGSAQFTSSDTVQATTADGTTWFMTFDPRSLRPIKTVDRCASAPILDD